MSFEHEANEVNVRIKSYHSDNGVFSSDKFKAHCKPIKQKLRFSGVGAKFQNSVAEQAIQTICNMARANMIHATLCWPGRPFIDMWPLVMNYAAWVHNRLPPGGDGLSPKEIWSSTRCIESHLPRAHVFGCPVYILDPKLQDGHQIPKWNSKVRKGIFAGFSPDHSTNVPLIYNPSTQHISPQFHVNFDDQFSTVPALTTEIQRDEIFEKLFRTSREKFIDDEDLQAEDFDPNLASELLGDEWLSPEELALRTSRRKPEGDLHASAQRPPPADPEGDEPADGVSEEVVGGDSEGAIGQDSEGDTDGVSEETEGPSRRPRRAKQSTWKDGPAIARTGGKLKLGACPTHGVNHRPL